MQNLSIATLDRTDIIAASSKVRHVGRRVHQSRIKATHEHELQNVKEGRHCVATEHMMLQGVRLSAALVVHTTVVPHVADSRSSSDAMQAPASKQPRQRSSWPEVTQQQYQTADAAQRMEPAADRGATALGCGTQTAKAEAACSRSVQEWLSATDLCCSIPCSDMCTH